MRLECNNPQRLRIVCNTTSKDGGYLESNHREHLNCYPSLIFHGVILPVSGTKSDSNCLKLTFMPARRQKNPKHQSFERDVARQLNSLYYRYSKVIYIGIERTLRGNRMGEAKKTFATIRESLDLSRDNKADLLSCLKLNFPPTNKSTFFRQGTINNSEEILKDLKWLTCQPETTYMRG